MAQIWGAKLIKSSVVSADLLLERDSTPITGFVNMIITWILMRVQTALILRSIQSIMENMPLYI